MKGFAMAIDESALKDILKDVLNEGRSINDDVHSCHHAFVANQIQKYDDKQELIKKFKLSFIGALAIGIASGMAWVGGLVLQALNRGG